MEIWKSRLRSLKLMARTCCSAGAQLYAERHPLEKLGARSGGYRNYSCSDITIGAMIKNVGFLEKLFPTDVIFDFQGIDIKFQDGGRVEPNFLRWFDAVEYYRMTKLAVSRDQIFGLEYHGRFV
ncbi:hypothetical protein MTO98_25690 [Mucilaginibacter sp. SMC90]|uniref:hypothetical protein n=1 Tax=Mucilaginibacter sp. SMC90 TaxID=2929803 RepID=UPI001FB35D2F|nr:hypothetical protein [Mucilaginibacter sp. SMC90]UOE47806.1 hypothetical protein MTO98_25690 [Mucilaginibacter sp. SMC90]